MGGAVLPLVRCRLSVALVSLCVLFPCTHSRPAAMHNALRDTAPEFCGRVHVHDAMAKERQPGRRRVVFRDRGNGK